MTRLHRKRGFTVVELLVALGIFGLLAVLAINIGRSSMQRAAFSSAVNSFVADFSAIKQQASMENRYMAIDFNGIGTGYTVLRQRNLDDFVNWQPLRTVTPMEGKAFFPPAEADDFMINSTGEVFAYPVSGTLPQSTQVEMSFFIYKPGTSEVDYQRQVRIFPTGGIKIDQ
ncbi:MAG: type II secretion system protein [Acidobacteriota bacterium]|nr:type II secretion system protein [Acidobacteriota bacterium]